MNRKKHAIEALASSDLLAVRPPSLLPNGKRNPAWSRWYYRKNRENLLEAGKKSKAKPAGKAAIRKYNQSEKHKAAKKRYKAKVVCVECGIEYRRDDAKEREYKMIGLRGCLCDLCR